MEETSECLLSYCVVNLKVGEETEKEGLSLINFCSFSRWVLVCVRGPRGSACSPRP